MGLEDNIVLCGRKHEVLQNSVTERASGLQRRGLKVNVTRSKITHKNKGSNCLRNCVNIVWQGKSLEVNIYEYFGVITGNNGGGGEIS